MGYQAGFTSQGLRSVAVGEDAGRTSQEGNAVAVGYLAGEQNQTGYSVAMGVDVGRYNQGSFGIAVGYQAGQTSQGCQAIAVGYLAGMTSQGAQAVAVGNQAGETEQGTDATAVGINAGRTSQGNNCTGIGKNAGSQNQQDNATAVGQNAGCKGQGTQSVAVGMNTGRSDQGDYSVAVGSYAGNDNQGSYAVAIGYLAGSVNQGSNAIAIGTSAGKTSLGSGSIEINATGTANGETAAGRTYILPTRDLHTTSGDVLGMTGQNEVARFTQHMHFNATRAVLMGSSTVNNRNGFLQIFSPGSNDKRQDAFMFKTGVDTNVIGFFVNTANQTRGSIGGATNSVSFNTTSDRRLKKQIKPMGSTLDRVNALKPCSFTWISDGMKSEGFIAQDVHEVFPEMRPVVPYSGCTCKCSTEKCESCPLCEDDHIYPKNKDGTDFHYGLDYGKLTPYLTKAIQELDTKVEERHNRKSLVSGVEYSKIDDYKGLIVCASNNEYINNRPVLKLSDTENDKTCYGVVMGKAESIDNETNIQKAGDGRMWVVNTHGNLESGDLVTTSNITGYGRKQDDDLLRSYTIAKLTQDCDFTEKTRKVKRIKQELKDVTYYIRDEWVLQMPQDKDGSHKDQMVEREVPMFMKTYDEKTHETETIITPEISETDYQKLPPDERKSYTVSYEKYITPHEHGKLTEDEKLEYTEVLKKGLYIKQVNESDKPMPSCCGEYRTDVRQEMVDVLDENGQRQWEDDPSNSTESEYEIRYLTTDGIQTDKENAVHIAVLVGCTYHWG